jgi:hypothetical protein
VAFFKYLPGDVANESGERNEQKFAFFHFSRTPGVRGRAATKV